MRILFPLLVFLAACNSHEAEITPAMLEGDWIHTEPWDGGGAWDGVTFRGDSIRAFGWLVPGSHWRRYELREGNLIVDGAEGESHRLRFNGDTLTFTSASPKPPGLALLPLVPLLQNLEAPVPDQIGISAGWCFGLCPQFDVAFDKSGDVVLRRYDEAEPLNAERARGAGEAVERLLSLAASLRADTTHFVDYNVDAQEVAITLRYGDSTHVHTGSVFGLGRLGFLFWEAREVIDQLSFEPAAESYGFESRAALRESR